MREEESKFCLSLNMRIGSEESRQLVKQSDDDGGKEGENAGTGYSWRERAKVLYFSRS